jgi:hypothetical protein
MLHTLPIILLQMIILISFWRRVQVMKLFITWLLSCLLLLHSSSVQIFSSATLSGIRLHALNRNINDKLKSIWEENRCIFSSFTPRNLGRPWQNLVWRAEIPNVSPEQKVLSLYGLLVSSLRNAVFQIKDRTMDNVQNCDSYINIPSSQTYR